MLLWHWYAAVALLRNPTGNWAATKQATRISELPLSRYQSNSILSLSQSATQPCVSDAVLLQSLFLSLQQIVFLIMLCSYVCSHNKGIRQQDLTERKKGSGRRNYTTLDAGDWPHKGPQRARLHNVTVQWSKVLWIENVTTLMLTSGTLYVVLTFWQNIK